LRQSRIVFVLEYFPPHVGGVETLFAHLTEALVRIGYAVSVVTLHLPGTETREVVNGVDIIRVRTPQRARRYLFTIMSLPAVLRHVAGADIVHTTTYNAAIPAWIAATLWRKPTVLTVHEVFADQWNTLLGLNCFVGYAFRAYEWAILHLPFARYACSSAFTRDRLVRLMHVDPARAAVVYPAIDYTFWDAAAHQRRDLRRDLGLDARTFLALYFGRTGISKGIEYLIDAMPRIRAQAPQSHLVMILAKDPADQYARLLQRITRLNLTEYVTILDPVAREELPQYLLAADAVIIPSVSEGFGYAAVEAVTLGCPVIATTGHAVEEVVGESVMLVPPRDPAALADAVIALADERPPHRPPKRYTVAAHIATMQTIYTGLIAGRTRQTAPTPIIEIEQEPTPSEVAQHDG